MRPSQVLGWLRQSAPCDEQCLINAVRVLGSFEFVNDGCPDLAALALDLDEESRAVEAEWPASCEYVYAEVRAGRGYVAGETFGLQDRGYQPCQLVPGEVLD